jgi:hypothetical protein
MASVILVIFASSAFTSSQFLKRKNNKIWALFFIVYCVLALYSINCTTAGQYWDQQIKNKEFNVEKADKENTSFLISQYEEKLIKLNEEKDNINARITASIENLSDMYYFRNTNKTAEQLKDEIENDIKEYENKLEVLLKENKVSINEKENIKMSRSLYEFYSTFLGLENHEKVQFVFQLLFSIIIELIAQISIYAFINIREYVKESKPEKKEKIIPGELRNFILLAWQGIKQKQSEYLNDKFHVIDRMKRVNPSFNENKYNIIIDLALKNKLIIKEKKELKPAEFVDSEFFYKEMLKLLMKE